MKRTVVWYLQKQRQDGNKLLNSDAGTKDNSTL